MKRNRKQKAADLAETLKDRDDARADYARCYTTNAFTPARVEEKLQIIKIESRESIAHSALPGLCWKPVFK